MSLKFKKSRDEVLRDITNATMASMSQVTYNTQQFDSLQLKQHINNLPWMVAQAVQAAFRSMLDNEYTDADFEKDLGIDESKMS